MFLFAVLAISLGLFSVGEGICKSLEVIKIFLMRNLTEHSICSARKYKNAKHCWYFNIFAA